MYLLHIRFDSVGLSSALDIPWHQHFDWFWPFDPDFEQPVHPVNDSPYHAVSLPRISVNEFKILYSFWCGIKFEAVLEFIFSIQCQMIELSFVCPATPLVKKKIFINSSCLNRKFKQKRNCKSKCDSSTASLPFISTVAQIWFLSSPKALEFIISLNPLNYTLWNIKHEQLNSARWRTHGCGTYRRACAL